jgi:hypothetical protein
MVIEPASDGTQVCFSLISSKLNYRVSSNGKLISSDANFADFSEINIDKQEIILRKHSFRQRNAGSL